MPHQVGFRTLRFNVIVGLMAGLSVLVSAAGVSAAPRVAALAGFSVTGVSPASGSTAGGNTVTIAGTGLSNVTRVEFRNPDRDGLDKDLVATGVTVTSDTSITAVVPASDHVGKVDVVALLSNGGPRTEPNKAARYTYMASGPIPLVTGVSAASGSPKGGNTVVVTGTGFTGATGVAFGSAQVDSTQFTVDSDTSITVTVPPAGAVTFPDGGGVLSRGDLQADVLVYGPDGVHNKISNQGVRYTYVAPTVTSISPSEGPAAGGNTVTITGSGFAEVDGLVFDGSAAFTIDSDTLITAIVPPSREFDPKHTVQIELRAGLVLAKFSKATRYTYRAPAITKITPASGPRAGGNTVTITGTNFDQVRDVYFDGTGSSPDFAVNSSTSITAIVPPGSGRPTVDVILYAARTQSPITKKDRYTYIP